MLNQSGNQNDIVIHFGHVTDALNACPAAANINTKTASDWFSRDTFKLQFQKVWELDAASVAKVLPDCGFRIGLIPSDPSTAILACVPEDAETLEEEEEEQLEEATPENFCQSLLSRSVGPLRDGVLATLLFLVLVPGVVFAFPSDFWIQDLVVHTLLYMGLSYFLLSPTLRAVLASVVFVAVNPGTVFESSLAVHALLFFLVFLFATGED